MPMNHKETCDHHFPARSLEGVKALEDFLKLGWYVCVWVGLDCVYGFVGVGSNGRMVHQQQFSLLPMEKQREKQK